MTQLPSDIARQLRPESLQHLLDALHAFPTYIRSRGEDYLLAGRVMGARVDGEDLIANVRGTRTYAVRWRFVPAGADPICSCPAGPICKHAYAVGLSALSEFHLAGLPLERRDANLLPVALRRARENTPSVPPSLVRTSAPVADARGSLPPSLRAFRDATSPHLRLDSLRQWLWKLGMGFDETAGLDGHSIVYEEDPEVRMWRLAHAFSRLEGAEVPKVLEPYLERTDLESRWREHGREHLVQRLGNWVGSRRGEPFHLRLVLSLADEGRGPEIFAEARLSGPKLQDQPRTTTQLMKLNGELRRDPTILSPPQARLLRLVTSNEMLGAFDSPDDPDPLSNEQLNLLLDRAAGSPFVVWGNENAPSLVARAGITPGSRVDFEGEELRVTLDAQSAGDELRLGVAIQAVESGRHASPDLILWRPERHALASQPTVALEGGAFHRIAEELPADIVEMLAEMNGVPLRREDGAVLDQLASRFPAITQALGAMTRTWDARPVIALDLRESDWLQVRLFAVSHDSAWMPGTPVQDPAVLFEYSPTGGWTRVASGATGAEVTPFPEAADAAPGSSDDAPESAAPAPVPPPAAAGDAPWREVPDPAKVAGALMWWDRIVRSPSDARGRARTCPEPDARTGGWVRVGARNLQTLIDAWGERPHDVAWFGNRSAQRLFAGARRVRARMRVIASGMDWLQVRADWESEGLSLTDDDLARLRNSREAFVRLAGGWVRREEAEAFDALASAAADLGLEIGGEEQRLTTWQLAQAKPESLERLAASGAGEETREAVERVRAAIAAFSGIPRTELPDSFVGELRPYQRDGFDFLAWTSSMGLGAVLADDMGLGKTVQALVWLQHLCDRDPSGDPALVVCPASVMHNWERESARFTPRLRVLVLGSGAGRRGRLESLSDYDLVVTNYALLRRDIELWRERDLRALVLDEAQNVKNPDAAVSRAARELHARNRLALTGTPLENRALDLWSILACVQPGYLGARAAFVSRYDRPDAAPWVRRLLAARLRPVMLRRLKEQVARDLPARIEERLDCAMTPGQRKLYLAELTRSRQLLGQLATAPDGLQRQRVVILAVLTKLRQICCHPALAGGRPDLGSGKFDVLFDLLEPLLAEGRKVLVFSQFVQCLDLIAKAMVERDVPYHVLTGATNTRDRASVVDAFTNDARPCAFLVSLKAGGTGLNLTAASDVVLFDPWWNPAVESQAVDRTHRIGQTRTVVAYRLYAEGTIEERIAELQQRKAELAKDVLGEDGFARSLNREDLEYLLAE